MNGENTRININIPKKPESYYKEKGWKGYKDFIGSNHVNPKQDYIDFSELKSFVKSKNIKTMKEFEFWNKNEKPENIPLYPNNTYKRQGVWVSRFFWHDNKP